MQDAPSVYRERWAEAVADTFDLVVAARDDAARDRGLKWVLVLSDALLRKFRRGRNSHERHTDVARRFTLWRDRDLRTLLTERDRDHAAARSRADGGDRDDDDAERARAIERALYLLSRCEPSRAANLLGSIGQIQQSKLKQSRYFAVFCGLKHVPMHVKFTWDFCLGSLQYGALYTQNDFKKK